MTSIKMQLYKQFPTNNEFYKLFDLCKKYSISEAVDADNEYIIFHFKDGSQIELNNNLMAIILDDEMELFFKKHNNKKGG